MSLDSSQPGSLPFTLPKGVTEADLLDWVERRPSSTAGVELAVRADPALATRLEQMRIDRAALGALPDAPAPRGLLDAVERTLERRMLVGLSAGEPLSDLPPVSTVKLSGTSPIGAIRGDAVGRRLALAAGLVLVVGGASVLGVVAMRFAGRSTAPVRITDATPLVTNPLGGPTDSASLSTEPETRLAIAETAPDAIVEGPPAPDDLPIAADPGMTLAKAARLAGEGRLVVRVRSRDIDRTLLRYGRITAQPRSGWRLGEDAPQAVVASLQLDRPRLIDPSIEPALPIWAGTQSMPGPLFPISLPRLESQRVMPTVFLARVRADEASIRAMLAALDATTVHTAVLEEAPSPLPPAGPTLSADAVLWWMQDPAGWQTWAPVPVVVSQTR